MVVTRFSTLGPVLSIASHHYYWPSLLTQLSYSSHCSPCCNWLDSREGEAFIYFLFLIQLRINCLVFVWTIYLALSLFSKFK